MKTKRNKGYRQTTLRLPEGTIIAARHQALAERVTFRELAERALNAYLKKKAGKAVVK
jgi:hypothetical protein